MLTVYIAGPITGNDDYVQQFNDAADRWRSAGWNVFNPVEIDGGNTEKPWRDYLRRDLKLVVDADAIAMLPGWEASRGASLEFQTAQGLAIPHFDAHHPARYADHEIQPLNACCNLPRYCHAPSWHTARGA